MRILVSCIPFDQGKSGISVYVRNIVAELTRQQHELTLIVEPGAEQFFPGYRLIVAPAWTRRAVCSMFYHLFLLPWRIRRKEYDFCIITAANRRAFCYYPLFTVGVVHDLANYHVPGKYDKLRMCYLRTVLPFFVRRASSVLAISESTAADCVKFWGIQPQKLFIAYNGLSLSGAADVAAGKSAEKWRKSLGLLNQKYLLYISRIESPGKNHLNLIRAYEALPAALQQQYALVFAGADWHGAEEVHAAAEASACRDRIIFAGFVGNADLPEAYIHASGYLFPSFFEGFGLSLIEAMHYGIPCACSNNSSLGEIGRNAALLFPPDDVAAMTQALQTLLGNPDERLRLIEAGKKRVLDFTWEKHVKAMVNAYEQSR